MESDDVSGAVTSWYSPVRYGIFQGIVRFYWPGMPSEHSGFII